MMHPHHSGTAAEREFTVKIEIRFDEDTISRALFALRTTVFDMEAACLGPNRTDEMEQVFVMLDALYWELSRAVNDATVPGFIPR